MRDLFINLFEKIVHIVVVVGAIAIILTSVRVWVSPPPGTNSIAVFLAVLIGGSLYLVLIAGFMYLGLGIYQNTKRTSEATEALLRG